MPIYEQDPKELLGEGIQQIAAPDDSNFYMETPSLLSAVNHLPVINAFKGLDKQHFV